MNSKQQYAELNDGHFIPGPDFSTNKPQEVRVGCWVEGSKESRHKSNGI